MTVDESSLTPTKGDTPPPTPQQAKLASTISTKINSLPFLIMGTWLETYPGNKQFNALMGGIPLADWSGLDPKHLKARKCTPRHFRPIDPVKGTKGEAVRTGGLDIKLKQSSKMNLHQFQN